MKGFLKYVLRGNIIYASYSSGLFSRLFAKGLHFSFIVDLNYSNNVFIKLQNYKTI